MIPPEQPQLVNHFIERENYTRNFMRMLKSKTFIQVGDTHGTYGTGKTNMLCNLYFEIKNHSGADLNLHPIWLSLSEFSISFDTPVLSDSLNDVEVLTHSLRNYHQLLLELAQEVMQPSQVDRVRTTNINALKEVLKKECDVKLTADEDSSFSLDVFMKVAKELIEVGTRAQGQKLAESIEVIAERFSKNFANLFNSKTFVTDYILFADDYCWVGDEALGRWFVNDLTRNLNKTTVVISRTREPEQDITRTDWWTLQLTDFTPEEVAFYLEKRLKLDILPDGLAENVYRFSNGHAQTVSLVADLLDYGRDEETQAIRPITFRNTDQGMEGQAQGLVKTLFENVRAKNEALAVALEVGAITRRFDRRLLGFVLGKRIGEPYNVWESDLEEGKEETKKQREAYEAKRNESLDKIQHLLEGYSFTEVYPSLNDYPHYAFHKFLREQMQTVLEQQYTGEVIELHTWIAEYYQALLGDYEDEQEENQQYSRLYRYEDAGWQDIIREWAYHSIHMEDRTEAKLRFALEFFNAFSWWGWFLRFPFCDNLISEWAWSQKDEDLPFLGHIIAFDEGYPRGYFTEKDGKGKWIQVHDSLFALFKELEIDPEHPEAMDDDRKELFVMMSETLAGAYRHHTEPDFAKAEALYHQTIAICQNAGEEMIDTFAYHNCFLADLYLQMKRYDDAVKHGKIAVDAMLQEPEERSEANDYEVASLGLRIMGTGYLRQGDIKNAIRCYQHSSLCAFIFISHPKNLADPYTCQWYIDTTQDITRELHKEWREGIAGIEEGLVAIREFWQPYWDKHDTPAPNLQEATNATNEDLLKAYLFPTDPDSKDKVIEKPDSQYNLDVLEVSDQMHKQLSGSLA